MWLGKNISHRRTTCLVIQIVAARKFVVSHCRAPVADHWDVLHSASMPSSIFKCLLGGSYGSPFQLQSRRRLLQWLLTLSMYETGIGPGVEFIGHVWCASDNQWSISSVVASLWTRHLPGPLNAGEDPKSSRSLLSGVSEIYLPRYSTPHKWYVVATCIISVWEALYPINRR